jgi:hypothetical protein
MGKESLVLRLSFGEGEDPEVEIVPLFLDEEGIPRPDPSRRTVDLLNGLSAEFGAGVESSGGRFIVRQHPS